MTNKKKYLSLTSVQWILVIVAVLFAISFTLLYYSFFYISNMSRVPASVIVDNKLGFNLTSDSLNFGSIPPGMCSNRILSIENTAKKTSKINIKITGEIYSWIATPNSTFTLEPNEKYAVNFNLCVPETADYGTHTGSVYILVKR